MSVDYQEILGTIRNNFADEVRTMEGSTGRWDNEHCIRTGSIGLDIATGIGGIPKGMITQLIGEYSSGKTSLALMIARNAQKQGTPVVFIDAEYSLTPSHARVHGVNVDELLVNQPNSQEEAIDLIVGICNQDVPALFIIDSIPALKSQRVMESDAETETRALEARRWAAQLPRVAKALVDSKSTLIMINQVRKNMDTSPWAPQFTYPGGEAIKFQSNLILFMRRRVEGKRNETGMDFQQCNVDLIKNKVGTPYKKASFLLHPSETVRYDEDIISEAMEWGIIDDSRKFEDGEELNKKGWHSIILTNEMIQAIIENDDPDFDPEQNVIQKYNYKPFMEELGKYPSIVPYLEDQLLEMLNDDDESSTLEESENDEDETQEDGE